MTFDETWASMEEGSFPFAIPDEAGDSAVHESDLIYIFEELREMYAPTVEMTQKQYDQFKTAKELVTLSELGYALIKKAAYSSLCNLSSEDLATAWLHPECIKVVDSDAQVKRLN